MCLMDLVHVPRLFAELTNWLCRSDVQVLFHDVVALTQKLFPIVEAMQKHFSAGSGAYYSDAIFFLSVAMHHIMPESKKNAFCHTSSVRLDGIRFSCSSPS